MGASFYSKHRLHEVTRVIFSDKIVSRYFQILSSDGISDWDKFLRGK